MSFFFLTKFDTQTTTMDELIDVVVQNKDLLKKQGFTNIGGINLYHFKDDNVVNLSYGSQLLRIDKCKVSSNTAAIKIGDDNDLYILVTQEDVYIADKENKSQKIPMEAFEDDVTFFQYTLLNLNYDCSEKHLIKLINFAKELLQ